MNALRVVPVVDGISTPSPCVTLSANDRQVFVGRANGVVDIYAIERGAGIPTVDHERTVDLGSKKPVTAIDAVAEAMVAISGDNVYVVSLVSKSASDVKPILLYKGAAAVSVRRLSDNSSTPGSPSLPAIIVSSLKKRLIVFKPVKGEYVQEGPEISTNQDLVTKLVWFNQWVVAGSSRSYLSVAVPGPTVVNDVLPVDSSPSITLLPATGEVLLVGQDGLGIFMHLHPDGLSPANRTTLSLSHSDGLSVLGGSYIASVASKEGLVEVFSLVSNDPKLVQTINLPASGIACACACSAGVPVIAAQVLYLLITVPFQTQVKRLMELKKFQDALELINTQFPAGTERESALAQFHLQVGWHLFHQAEFAVALLHLSMVADAKVATELLGFWDNNAEGLKKVIRDLGTTVEEDEAIDAGNGAVVVYARGVMLAGKRAKEVEEKAVNILIRLLPETELVELVKSAPVESLVAAREVIRMRSCTALAALLERTGDVRGAVDVLVEALPKSENDLFDLVHRRWVDMGGDSGTVKRVVEAMAAHACTPSKIAEIVKRDSTPMSLVDSLMLGSSAEGKLAARIVLESLALTIDAAKERLVQAMVDAEDWRGLEEVVTKFQIQDIPNVDKQESSFARMLTLSNQSKHREAFIQFPELGTEFIDRVTSSDQERRVDLVLLFASVLFEHAENAKAIEQIVSNASILGHMSEPSRLIRIIPNGAPVTAPLIHLLKQINASIHNRQRSGVVQEHLLSYKFFKTYSEWSKFRQSSPTVVTEDTACAICAKPVPGVHPSLAVLPNGNIIHPSCLDATAFSTKL